MKYYYCMHDYHSLEEEHMHTVPFINEVINSGHASDMILVTEAIQEKNLARIAEAIAKNPKIRVVLLAGPSSSGKTSTSKRLCIQLMACRKHPVALSTDNWFVDRKETPRDADGNYDFECIEAMDLKLFNRNINDLLAGKDVQIPSYNFKEGRKEYLGEHLQLTPDMILVIEGIHALNPVMTGEIPGDSIFRIFAAPMSPVSLDGKHWIPTRANRLFRRISRDYQTRGRSASETIAGWESVLKGEEKWIFPFKDKADAQFDTSMLYELAAIKPKAEPVLKQVAKDDPQYETVARLLKFLSYFQPIEADQIPRNSLLREFVGGSIFNVG